MRTERSDLGILQGLPDSRLDQPGSWRSQFAHHVERVVRLSRLRFPVLSTKALESLQFLQLPIDFFVDQIPTLHEVDQIGRDAGILREQFLAGLLEVVVFQGSSQRDLDLLDHPVRKDEGHEETDGQSDQRLDQAGPELLQVLAESHLRAFEQVFVGHVCHYDNPDFGSQGEWSDRQQGEQQNPHAAPRRRHCVAAEIANMRRTACESAFSALRS